MPQKRETYQHNYVHSQPYRQTSREERADMPPRERHTNIIMTHSQPYRQTSREERADMPPRERHTNIIMYTVRHIDRQAERREQTCHQERDIPT